VLSEADTTSRDTHFSDLSVSDLLAMRQNWSSSPDYEMLGVDRYRGFKDALR
jgi:hypothetical protein